MGAVRHDVEILSYGSLGCRATCSCGWRSGLYSPACGASIAFAEHLRDQPQDDA